MITTTLLLICVLATLVCNYYNIIKRNVYYALISQQVATATALLAYICNHFKL